MPEYLFEASCTADGVKGSSRPGPRAASRPSVICAPDSVAADFDFAFAFGDVGAFVVCDLPDDKAAAAAAFAVGDRPTGS